MIEPGDILPDDMVIVPETGEVIPKPQQYTEYGAPLWEFGPGDVFPMTGEVLGEGEHASIACFSPTLQRPPAKLTWFQRLIERIQR